MEFETPYLTKQIITYIGNKRKLLSLIYKAMKAVGAKMENGTTFLDLFSGSGVVLSSLFISAVIILLPESFFSISLILRSIEFSFTSSFGVHIFIRYISIISEG